MTRLIDQIRASKLPSNMMQFAARGALQVSAAENIEILVHLARHNKVFGDTARMTLAGWDHKACLDAVSDPQTPLEVLNYFISPDNVRPKLLPALLENPSVHDTQLVKLAGSALRETLEIMLQSQRVRSTHAALEALHASPYLKKEESEELERWLHATVPIPQPAAQESHEEHASAASAEAELVVPHTTAEPHDIAPVEVAHSEVAHSTEAAECAPAQPVPAADENPEATVGADDETVFSYLQQHAQDIAAEGDKPFQAIGGTFDLLTPEYFHEAEGEALAPAAQAAAAPEAHATAHAAHPQLPKGPPKRENTFQKINSLDVKGRIQLALKGNKEERSILIRDGTKVVALAVLEAPKLADGEVEKFASQKNVLEAVLRQIPLKRRFMKNYIVVRNLVANPRTPLDLGLGLMKNLLAQDLKNLSANKEVSETIRKLAMKMYKQKLDAANKK
jgi:hypothetical protein